jgi:stress response protein YsnF
MSGYEAAIPVAEETARIDKREVETGRVKVHTVVESSEAMVREDSRREL